MTTVMTAVIKHSFRGSSNRMRRRKHNRALPRVELRERIQQAAFRLFREQGFDHTSVDQIVDVAGVAKGTFFNFYRTKQAVLGDYYAELDVFMSASLRGLDPRHPASSLGRLFLALEQRLRDEGDLARVLFREVMQNPSLGITDLESGADDCKQYELFVERCRSAGTVCESAAPHLVAEVVQDLWASTLQRWFHARQSFSLADALMLKIDVLFRGIEAKPSAGREAGPSKF